MDGTPRLRSAFPNTPPTRRTPRQNPSPTPNSSAASLSSLGGRSFGSPRLRDISELSEPKAAPPPPLIPLETIDAPKQRLYVVATYIALLSWRLFDFINLVQDQEESLWLFMKWAVIDGVFLFGLPSMHIPWLEWSATTMTILFVFHAVIDGILMFRIPIPLMSALLAFGKVIWDKEITLSEHSIKAGSILHDASHILGGYTIHVLPEGSAVLNPQQIPICLENAKSASNILPLQINQTLPTTIELIRFDLQKPLNESIKLSASQTRKLIKAAEKKYSNDLYGALVLEYAVTKPGLYRLGRVIDETNMEVSHPVSETLVVQCPAASIKSAGPSRCRGELSNIALEVEGSPPLKIKYRKSVDQKDEHKSYQSIQPDDFVYPFLRKSGKNDGSLIATQAPDLTWAGMHKMTVPLNETLSFPGLWSYSIDEVSDAYGNVVSYGRDDTDFETSKPKALHLDDQFKVHSRPVASLRIGDSKSPIRKARGERYRIPTQITEGGKHQKDSDYNVAYKYTPLDDIKENGDHAEDSKVVTIDPRNEKQNAVSKPGLYTLMSVESDHCSGEVEEPTSFMLINPSEPQLQISPQIITDKCAGRPVGLHVDLSLEGTPDFTVFYTAQQKGSGHIEAHHQSFSGPRGQLDLKPRDPGHWVYQFTQLEDSVYKGISLRGKSGLTLEQEVRPSVYAQFVHDKPSTSSCIDSTAAFDVRLQGEGPWVLEYEVVHGRSRASHKIESSSPVVQIVTPPLTKGGEYSVTLAGVTDKEGCREALQQHATVNVRHQRPRASFGLVEGKRSIRTLESKPAELPVRLTGEGPWSVDIVPFTTDADGTKQPGQKRTVRVTRPNDLIAVSQPGSYAITSVQDNLCPGVIDDKASTFEVAHVERPRALAPQSPLMERHGDKYVRKDVCEGDEDAFDLNFSGRQPYVVKYEERFKPELGSKSLKNSELTVPMNNAKIKIDTTRAGVYEYVVTELSDENYDYEPRRHVPLTVEQRVHSRPTATFDTGNKVHSFCQSKVSSVDSEQIPVTFSGLPPFAVDLEVRHSSASKAAKPQTLTIPNLMSHTVKLSIPHRLLQPGASTISIHRIRDARGCERIYDSAAFLTSSSNTQRQAALANAPPRMQIAVHDAPHLTPLDPDKIHYCVGERLAFALSGTAPFTVQYSFRGRSTKTTVSDTTFRRVAESPGNFTIQSIADSASACRAAVPSLSRAIHDLPRVKVSKGERVRYDIHAGGSVDVLFEFAGDPPFTFTYERREAPKTRPGKGAGAGAEYGRPGRLLDTKTLVADERSLTVSETQEGTYDVVAVSDRWCKYARPGYEGVVGGQSVPSSRLLEDVSEESEDEDFY